MIVSLTAASAIILFSADGRTPEDWKIRKISVQPAVYVSMLEMIISIHTFRAISDVHYLWRRLLRGTTVGVASYLLKSRC
jgi:hypothetical protein